MIYLFRLSVYFLLPVIFSYAGKTGIFTFQSENKKTVAGNIQMNEPDSVKSKIVFLTNGINSVDLNGDGIKDLAISGFRNNSTAHVFNYYTFYIYDKNYKSNNSPPWCIVEIEDNKKNPDKTDNYCIWTNEGADGILTDAALVRDENGKLWLLLANREFGESYADPGKVTFTYYSLDYYKTENRFIYKVKSKKISNNNYVDVREAINAEIK